MHGISKGIALMACAQVALAISGGCSAVGSKPAEIATSDTAPQSAVAVRSAPVVVGRPARVFIFAGIGDNCESLPPPEVTVTAPPAKGDVSFVPGQDTTIEVSAKGTCSGTQAKGTGVYYTARAGAEGSDRFSVIAKLASGESFPRTFEINIAP